MSELFLILEASTPQASAALIEDQKTVAAATASSSDSVTGTRVEALAPMVDNLFHKANRSVKDLSAVVCGAGPGSFTSLRGAASIAKGMCTALGIPLYAVPTPSLIVARAGLVEGRFLVIQDAGRDEVYATLVEINESAITGAGQVSIVARRNLNDVAEELSATILSSSDRQESIESGGLAAAASTLMSGILASGPVNLIEWEPVYGRLAEAQVKWEAKHGRPLTL